MIKCPKCEIKISVAKVRGKFCCENCSAQLSSNINIVSIFAFICWALIGTVTASEICGSDLSPFTCFVSVDTLVGGIVFLLIIMFFTKVSFSTN